MTTWPHCSQINHAGLCNIGLNRSRSASRLTRNMPDSPNTRQRWWSAKIANLATRSFGESISTYSLQVLSTLYFHPLGCVPGQRATDPAPESQKQLRSPGATSSAGELQVLDRAFTSGGQPFQAPHSLGAGRDAEQLPPSVAAFQCTN